MAARNTDDRSALFGSQKKLSPSAFSASVHPLSTAATPLIGLAMAASSFVTLAFMNFDPAFESEPHLALATPKPMVSTWMFDGAALAAVAASAAYWHGCRVAAGSL